MARSFQKLTRRTIRALAPGQKITEGGITAEKLSDGDVRYTVAFMVDGQRIHRVVGLASNDTTRTQAEDFIAKARSEAKEQRLKLPKGRKLHLTFETAAKLYVDKLEESGGKNVKEKKWHLRLHLTPYFGSMRLEKISTFTLEKFRRHCSGKDLSISTTNQLLATYRHMGRKLHEWGDINFIPPMVKMEAADNARDYVLSDDDKTGLLNAALEDSNQYIWLFITMGLHTSLRHSEILSGRFENFDSERRRLLVKVKGGHWREQPLTRTITDVLKRDREMASETDGWIFPNSISASKHYESMKTPFRRVVLAAGLDPQKVTPHTLRHTAITDLAETGAAIRTVQEFSGHTSVEMVMRYTHAREQQVDQALEKLDQKRTNQAPAKASKRGCS